MKYTRKQIAEARQSLVDMGLIIKDGDHYHHHDFAPKKERLQ